MDCCALASDLDAAALYDRLSALETIQDVRSLTPARDTAPA
jgi:hypothetical protein